MQTSRVIHSVSCHAEGEVGDVIVGGVAPPPGETQAPRRTPRAAALGGSGRTPNSAEVSCDLYTDSKLKLMQESKDT